MAALDNHRGLLIKKEHHLHESPVLAVWWPKSHAHMEAFCQFLDLFLTTVLLLLKINNNKERSCEKITH